MCQKYISIASLLENRLRSHLAALFYSSVGQFGTHAGAPCKTLKHERRDGRVFPLAGAAGHH